MVTPASFWVACLDCVLKLAWKWQLLWLPVVSMVETTWWFPFQSNLTAKSCDHPNQPIRSLHSLKSPRKLQNLWDFVRFHAKFYSHLKSKAVRTALLKTRQNYVTKLLNKKSFSTQTWTLLEGHSRTILLNSKCGIYVYKAVQSQTNLCKYIRGNILSIPLHKYLDCENCIPESW